MTTRFRCWTLSLAASWAVLVVGGPVAGARGPQRPTASPPVDAADAAAAARAARDCSVALVVVRPGSEPIDVPVVSEHATALLLPDAITSIDPPRGNGIEATGLRDIVLAVPGARSRPGDTLSTTIATRAMTASLRFRTVDDEARARRLVMVVDGATSGLDQTGQTGQTGMIDCLPAQLDALTHARSAEYALLSEMAEHYERVPIPPEEGDEDAAHTPPRPGVHLRADAWGITQDNRLLFFEIENRTLEAYRVFRISVHDDVSTQDRGYSVWLGGRPMDSAGAEIEPGGRVSGWVWIRDPVLLGSHVSLSVSDPDGDQPLVRNRIPVWDLRRVLETEPPTPEELEQQRREREARRVSLHVMASYGAIWLPADADGFDDTSTDAASLQAFGVRVTKGLFPLLAIEIDAVAARSGIVSFRNGAGDELTRSARLGRVSFGGVLRLGGVDATVTPTLRLGVGLQVVDQDATLMTGSGPVDGPDAGLEVGGSVYGGGGVDVKLGSNWIAGVGLAFTQSDQRILELGFNLAYRWGAAEPGPAAPLSSSR